MLAKHANVRKLPQGFVSRNFTVPRRSPAGNLMKGGNHYAAQRTEDCYHRRQPYPRDRHRFSRGSDRHSTERINQLTVHMQNNPQDKHSNRGLLKMVGKRRSLLDYLQKKDIERYRALIAKLGIRK